MGDRRTFRITIRGVDYDVPTSFGLLHEGIHLADKTLDDFFAFSDSPTIEGTIVYAKGMATALLRSVGVTEIDGVEVDYNTISTLCEWDELMSAAEAMKLCMTPSTAGKSSKNARKGEPKSL